MVTPNNLGRVQRTSIPDSTRAYTADKSTPTKRAPYVGLRLDMPREGEVWGERVGADGPVRAGVEEGRRDEEGGSKGRGRERTQTCSRDVAGKVAGRGMD